jgi:hypothetical protein
MTNGETQTVGTLRRFVFTSALVTFSSGQDAPHFDETVVSSRCQQAPIGGEVK